MSPQSTMIVTTPTPKVHSPLPKATTHGLLLGATLYHCPLLQRRSRLYHRQVGTPAVRINHPHHLYRQYPTPKFENPNTSTKSTIMDQIMSPPRAPSVVRRHRSLYNSTTPNWSTWHSTEFLRNRLPDPCIPLNASATAATICGSSKRHTFIQNATPPRPPPPPKYWDNRI